MEISERQVRRLLWEAHMIFSDPHHPINDRRHPKHHEAIASYKLIAERGRRLLKAQEPQTV
jgi:hypothetical protein